MSSTRYRITRKNLCVCVAKGRYVVCLKIINLCVAQFNRQFNHIAVNIQLSVFAVDTITGQILDTGLRIVNGQL
jgi:hypothetical protein